MDAKFVLECVAADDAPSGQQSLGEGADMRHVSGFAGGATGPSHDGGVSARSVSTVRGHCGEIENPRGYIAVQEAVRPSNGSLEFRDVKSCARPSARDTLSPCNYRCQKGH